MSEIELTIYKYGSDILRKRAKEVKKIDTKIIQLAKDMINTMFNAHGIGLAANQVGYDVQVLAADFSTDPEKHNPVVLINPKILQRRGKVVMEEGCLSFPGIHFNVKRAKWIKVSAKNLNGVEVILEMEGLPARILQHEIDHLNGKLFIDYLPLLKKLSVCRMIKVRKKQNQW